MSGVRVSMHPCAKSRRSSARAARKLGLDRAAGLSGPAFGRCHRRTLRAAVPAQAIRTTIVPVFRVTRSEAAKAEFDKEHQGNVPFYEEVSQNNVAALEHLLVCLAGEVGELANVIKKIRRGDATFLEKRDDIAEETVDVFIYLVKLANQVGFDLEATYNAKMETNRQRFERYKS